MHALIFGSSHANAVARARRSFRPENPAFSFHILAAGASALPGGPILELAGGGRTLNPIIIEAVERNARNKERELWLVSILGGNYHNRLSLLQGSEPFDFVLPGREDLGVSERVRLVPYDLVCASLRGMTGRLDQCLVALKELPVAGVIHAEAPGPVRSSEAITAKLPPATVKLAARREGGDRQMEVSPPVLRLKTWLAQKRIVQEICARAGVVYLDVPSSFVDEDGFRNASTMSDALHGNEEYGSAVLSNIERATMGTEALVSV